MNSYQLIDVIEVGNNLGEGVQWHREQQALWWTDITEAKLYRCHWLSRAVDVYPMPEPVGCFAFVQGRDDIIVLAFASGFASYCFATGEVSWFAKPAMKGEHMRFNDGRVDRQGRFWAGTMDPDFSLEEAGLGQLFCLDTNGVVTEHERDIYISNGACWSPDGKQFYFADSPKGEMYRYDFDIDKGELSNRQVFAHTPKGAGPDGACVDSEGFIWSAHWGIGEVCRYSPAGEVDKVVKVPALQPSCVAFGGEHLDILFVTSAKQDLGPEQLAGDPKAGHVFAFQTDVRGLPESLYKG